MANEKNNILDEVANYYTAKLSEHGETPHGVDWNGEAGQSLRFKQLSKIITTENRFSINDIGCGFGSLHDYLTSNYQDFSYFGVDISKEMILTAEQRYKDNKNTHFIIGDKPNHIADYSVASGIFNVCQTRSKKEWSEYINSNLDILDKNSKLGFAFNCLTSYSDADKMKDYLYYADPCILFDKCKKSYSKNVTLLHDYDLYEFTILVRK